MKTLVDTLYGIYSAKTLKKIGYEPYPYNECESIRAFKRKRVIAFLWVRESIVSFYARDKRGFKHLLGDIQAKADCRKFERLMEEEREKR